MKTIFGIQYLRAFAAIAVVLFHAAERTGHSFAIGAAGVDVFFVISGFIMWVISDRRAMNPAGFLIERARRIVPVYWAATAVMVFGALFGLFPNLTLSPAHVLASLFFIPAQSPSSGEIWPVLVQGWTLNFEMFFYLAFALSLGLARRWRLVVVAAFFVALVAIGAGIDTGNALLFTYTRPIMLEFVAGMMIGQLWLKGKIPGQAVGLGLVLFAMAGFAVICLFRLPFGVLSCGPLAVALVTGVLSLEAAGRLRPWCGLVFLGDASYSIYIWHTFAISVIARFGTLAGLPAGATFLAAVFGGTALGSAAYLLLERPLAKYLRSSKPISGSNPVAPAAKEARQPSS